jgi:hypothetical protein
MFAYTYLVNELVNYPVHSQKLGNGKLIFTRDLYENKNLIFGSDGCRYKYYCTVGCNAV